ncbi:ADP-ribose pyrophosphatase YjhB (NUDIX family) [Anoxybacillus caldiproteolyticus]|uniref:ADP-ribose pyrophosphatase YjhB (NUDIX family) n=1 Tax=Thermaerobacillus caldiproteolyticus TaxID=247480 RepID=A0A7V9Z7D8_9BACL|nr:ADP-ribose pyrophosphatase YjhB (NUDIX family) [Anoxybacillus caldiproteolyticus]
MKKWFGSVEICINDHAELLMVLQGKSGETKTWSIPSRKLENNETFSECCIREINEETGYDVQLVEEVYKIFHTRFIIF